MKKYCNGVEITPSTTEVEAYEALRSSTSDPVPTPEERMAKVEQDVAEVQFDVSELTYILTGKEATHGK